MYKQQSSLDKSSQDQDFFSSAFDKHTGTLSFPPPGKQQALQLNGFGNQSKQEEEQEKQIVEYQTTGDKQTIKKYNKDMQKVLNLIKEEVQIARPQAILWNTFGDSSDNYLKDWYHKAKSYFDDPVETPSLIHAKFGYAVETFVNKSLKNKSLHGFEVELQKSKGGTRPDIVLNKDGKEVAWIDITSEDSIGHIKRKQSSSWKTKPFVAEVTYKALDLKEILNVSGDPVYRAIGNYNAGLQNIVLDETVREETRLSKHLSDLRDHQDPGSNPKKIAWETGFGNAQKKREETREALIKYFGQDQWGKHAINGMKETLHALRVLEMYDGPFGFNRGGIGSEGNAIEKLIYEKASPRIKSRQDAYNRNQILNINHDLFMFGDTPLAKDLKARRLETEVKKWIQMGRATVVTLDKQEELWMAFKNWEKNDPNARKSELYEGTVIHFNQFPKKAEIKDLQEWCKIANILLRAIKKADSSYRQLDVENVDEVMDEDEYDSSDEFEDDSMSENEYDSSDEFEDDSMGE